MSELVRRAKRASTSEFWEGPRLRAQAPPARGRPILQDPEARQPSAWANAFQKTCRRIIRAASGDGAAPPLRRYIEGCGVLVSVASHVRSAGLGSGPRSEDLRLAGHGDAARRTVVTREGVAMPREDRSHAAGHRCRGEEAPRRRPRPPHQTPQRGRRAPGHFGAMATQAPNPSPREPVSAASRTPPASAKREPPSPVEPPVLAQDVSPWPGGPSTQVGRVPNV